MSSRLFKKQAQVDKNMILIDKNDKKLCNYLYKKLFSYEKLGVYAALLGLLAS
jgi:hypothetical protein